MSFICRTCGGVGGTHKPSLLDKNGIGHIGHRVSPGFYTPMDIAPSEYTGIDHAKEGEDYSASPAPQEPTAQEELLLAVLKDMVIRCAPDGTQDDGDFIGFYVLPTGPVHRALAALQNAGVSADTMGDVTVISRYQAHLKQLIEAEATRRSIKAREDEQKLVTEWLTDAEHVGTIREFNQLRRMKLEAELKSGEQTDGR